MFVLCFLNFSVLFITKHSNENRYSEARGRLNLYKRNFFTFAVTVIIFLWVVNTSVMFVEKCNFIKHNGTQSYFNS